MPAGTGVPDARVVHAPGGPGATRIPGRPRLGVHPGRHRRRPTVGRAHAATGTALRRGRRRFVLRHRGPPPRHRLRRRRRAGPRPGGGPAVPQRGGPGSSEAVRTGERRPLRRRDRWPGPSGARGFGGGADRFRRRTVHRGQLRHRRRAVPHVRQGQGPHAREPRPVATVDRAARRHGRGLAPGADRGGRPGRPDLRQLGRLACARRVRPLRPSRHVRRPGRHRRSRRADDSLRRRHRRVAGPDGFRRVGCRRHRLARAARRGAPPHRRRARRAGQPRPCALPGAVADCGRRHPLRSGQRRRRDRHRLMCSTWVTAFYRSRTRASWPPSSNWSTRRPRGHDDGRPAHGARHASEHGGDRPVLHAHPPRASANARAARPSSKGGTRRSAVSRR